MTVILLRHGQSTSNIAQTLAGRSAGIGLTERGQAQAGAVAERLAGLPIVRVVSSPLPRCRDTAARLGFEVVLEERLTEIDYGEWTGRALAELVDEPLWQVVQARASAARFPGGEGLAQAQARALEAVREHDEAADGLWVACTHGDIVKAVLADALGLHLDGFQRISVEPASVSVVRYTATGAQVLRMGDTGELSGLAGGGGGPVPGGETGADT